jgi:hypothetical protein
MTPSIDMVNFSDDEYLRCDLFGGERDVDIRCRTVKIAKVRKSHKCHGFDRETHGHTINPGERARYEKAIVDGKWERYYMCLGCMDKFLIEYCDMKPCAH